MEEALELYDILSVYLPDVNDIQPDFDFIGKIVNNIAEAKSGAYAEALHLMTKQSFEELPAFSSVHLLELFVTGLTINNIVGLMKFCRDINYGR